jgi:uncharacterized membrane protein
MTTKKVRIGLIVLGLLVAVSIVAGAPAAILDGPTILLNPLFPADTEYGPGYSHWKFLRVREGMSEQDVKALLGEPLRIHEAAETHQQIWEYSRSPSKTNFRCRTLTFTGSLVSDIHSEFYID